MKKLILLLMLVSSILLVACSASFSARRAKEVLPQFLSSIYSTTTVNHIAYFGSDSDFHYFFHSQLFGGGSYKVAKKKMSLQQEFALSSDHEPVLLIGRYDEATGAWISPRPASQ
jgi:major membrane immunogen (membrane-anchored lipoprotein)